MKVSELLKAGRSYATTVHSAESIQSVAKRFREKGVRVLMLKGRGGAIEGILTERDVALGLAVHGRDLPAMSASALSATPIATCSCDDSITDIAKLMAKDGLDYLTVEDGGHAVGVIGIADVLMQRIEDRREVTRRLSHIARH